MSGGMNNGMNNPGNRLSNGMNNGMNSGMTPGMANSMGMNMGMGGGISGGMVGGMGSGGIVPDMDDLDMMTSPMLGSHLGRQSVQSQSHGPTPFPDSSGTQFGSSVMVRHRGHNPVIQQGSGGISGGMSSHSGPRQNMALNNQVHQYQENERSGNRNENVAEIGNGTSVGNGSVSGGNSDNGHSGGHGDSGDGTVDIGGNSYMPSNFQLSEPPSY